MAGVKVMGSAPVEATAETRPDLFGTRGQLRPDGAGGMVSMMLADKPEYATPEASGVESGFYVGDRGLPWHVTLSRQLNTPELMKDADHLLTKEEALEAVGGNFTVALKELAVAESGIIIPNRFVTVREDTGQPLGVVGRAYKLHQPEVVADFADQLVGSGIAKYETGGIMQGGAWFFLSMELDHLDITVPGDPSPLKSYLFLRTSFDGSTHTEGHITRVRTVCRNTARLAGKRAVTSFRIQHRGTLPGKVEQARAALGIMVRSTEKAKENAERLALTRIIDSQVREILEKAVWPVKAAEGDAEAERQSRHAERAMEIYLGSPNIDGIRGTAWGAFNAVTEYTNHGLKYNSRSRAVEDLRADSLLFGPAAETEDRALRALLAVK